MTTTFKEAFPASEPCQILTCLPEKFVVDFANGIDVVHDHLRQQQDRGFFLRLKEGFSGKASTRQQAVNAALLDGVEASLQWLTELTSSLATTNYALEQVNDRLSSLVEDTAQIANYAADTREQLVVLAAQVHDQFAHQERALAQLDRVQRGHLHLEEIFSNWGAGRYAALPLAGRCFVALEELRWGAFGDVIRHGEPHQVRQMQDILKNRALAQLELDSRGRKGERHDTRNWLAWQAGQIPRNDWPDTVHWIGDWCNQDEHPVVWSTTQQYDTLPLRMPRLSSAERIADSMVDEIFSKEAI